MAIKSPGDRLVPLAMSVVSQVLLLSSAAAANAAPPAILATTACLHQVSAPAIVHHAHFADARFGARTQTVVQVDLGHDGIVRHVQLVGTSGDARFDAAAVAAAQESAFASASHGCIAIDSHFDEAFTAKRGDAVVATINADRGGRDPSAAPRRYRQAEPGGGLGECGPNRTRTSVASGRFAVDRTLAEHSSNGRVPQQAAKAAA
jgi:hypothetical protein